MFDINKYQKALDLMSNEGRSARKAAAEIGIDSTTLLLWANTTPERYQQYTRARSNLLAYWADEVISISDAPVGSSDKGGMDAAAIAKQRLQVDSRKWILSKLAPKVYGDRMTHAGDAENPIAISRIELVAPSIASSAVIGQDDDSQA